MPAMRATSGVIWAMVSVMKPQDVSRVFDHRDLHVGGYIVMAWLIVIALTLLIGGQYYDVAVRDVVMAVGAFSLVARGRPLLLHTSNTSYSRIRRGISVPLTSMAM